MLCRNGQNICCVLQKRYYLTRLHGIPQIEIIDRLVYVFLLYMDDFIDTSGESQYFSKLEAYCSYCQMNDNQKDVHKT